MRKRVVPVRVFTSPKNMLLCVFSFFDNNWSLSRFKYSRYWRLLIQFLEEFRRIQLHRKKYISVPLHQKKWKRRDARREKRYNLKYIQPVLTVHEHKFHFISILPQFHSFHNLNLLVLVFFGPFINFSFASKLRKKSYFDGRARVTRNTNFLTRQSISTLQREKELRAGQQMTKKHNTQRIYGEKKWRKREKFYELDIPQFQFRQARLRLRFFISAFISIFMSPRKKAHGLALHEKKRASCCLLDRAMNSKLFYETTSCWIAHTRMQCAWSDLVLCCFWLVYA